MLRTLYQHVTLTSGGEWHSDCRHIFVAFTQQVQGNGEELPMFRLKRAYEAVDASDGTRVLVDRLWPRGLSKAEAHVDLWLKEVAPSAELRKWYGHDPQRFDEFRRRYLVELQDEAVRQALKQLRDLARRGTVTLLVGARDSEHSDGAVLLELLQTPEK